MSGEATNAASVAILNRRYQGGRVPRTCHEDTPFYSNVQKKEDFVGDDYVIPIQTANPQGFGPTVADAQGAAAQGTYLRALLTRVETFGVCRIKGQALKTATTKGGGALVDLWKNEMDGCTQTFLKRMEAYGFGDGNGVLGTISSGQASTALVLTVVEDVENFDVGMPLNAVSDTTLSPTIRSGSNTITALDRSTGTLTAATVWNVAISGCTSGDSLVAKGTGSVSGTPVIPAGLRQWLVGGTSPAAWKSLTRTSDTVALAGQTYDATGVPMSNALADLESLITIRGKRAGSSLWCNPRDLRQWKKSLDAKVTYPRAKVNSQVAGVSFEAIEYDGDYGTIKMMGSPFCPRYNAFLLDESTFAMYSAGPAPMPLNLGKDSNSLVVPTDDALEVRIGQYGDYGCNCPIKSARMTGWGQ